MSILHTINPYDLGIFSTLFIIYTYDSIYLPLDLILSHLGMYVSIL